MGKLAILRKRQILILVALIGGVRVPALAQSATRLTSLPLDAQGPISAALGKDDSGYWIHRSAAGLRGENPRHSLAAEFTREGVELRSQNLRWRLEMQGYGYGDALHSLNAAAPIANANRVEYRRNEVTEWYENGPLGLEQGFTLDHPPGKANGRALTLELRLTGDLLPILGPGGKGLDFTSSGKSVLRYAGLEARDATGRPLRTWLELVGERLLLRVDDNGARYPVVVDPWIQQAKLTASDGQAGDYFGTVAISGSTILVGAANHPISTLQGAAYVFVQSGGTWTQQAELTASDGAAGDAFGLSVAISGSTAVVGAYQHKVASNDQQGAAYVFIQSGGRWIQQAELIASDGAAGDEFGHSVAVSATTVLVGSPFRKIGSNNEQGAAYVFVESGGTWTQQAELTASDGAASDRFGWSIAVSGSTVVIGAPNHNNIRGAAYVFAESSGIWGQQAELTASDGAGFDEFGSSVGAEGSTAVVGAPNHTVGSNAEQGAAYVFVGSGGTWSQQTELTASDGAPYDELGSVSISGNTIVVGAPNHKVGSNSFQGAAYVFAESGGTWTQQAELTASDGAAYDFFGGFVGVSGSMAVVGAAGPFVGPSTPGAAYVFESSVTLTFPTGNFTLAQGASLSVGYLTLVMQADGNLVLYGPGGTAVWDTGTYGQDCGSNQCYAIFQTDGNLVVYNGSTPLWNSGTFGNPGAELILSTQTPQLEIVVAGNQSVLWSSVPQFSAGTFKLAQGASFAIGSLSLVMQNDGNLVLYQPDGTAVWNTGTYGQDCGSDQCFVTFQSDGNLVVYNGSTPLWSSGTFGYPEAELILSAQTPQLEIIDSNQSVLWSNALRFSADTFKLAQGASFAIGSLSLVMQGDGNLVLYQADGIPVWNTGTYGQDCGSDQCFAIFQSDGNLVVYNGSTPLWSSGTSGNPGAELALSPQTPQLEIIGSNQAVLWAN